MSEREKFEEWYCREYWDFRKGTRCQYFASGDSYTLMDVQLAYCSWKAALSASPTPPEVEPVAYVARHKDFFRTLNEAKAYFDESELTPLFTSPPSPKAEWFNGDVDCDGNELITIRKDAHEPRWDAEGNPLNLEAAAMRLLKCLDCEEVNKDIENEMDGLRKFTGEQGK